MRGHINWSYLGDRSDIKWTAFDAVEGWPNQKYIGAYLQVLRRVESTIEQNRQNVLGPQCTYIEPA